MRFRKGDVIQVDNIFYVVIDERRGGLDCICDNANNIYHWETKDVGLHLTAKQAVEINSFGASSVLSGDDLEAFQELGRPIPVDVIAEALVGIHDHRFSHWR